MIRFILYKHSLIDLAIKHIYNKKYSTLKEQSCKLQFRLGAMRCLEIVLKDIVKSDFYL